MRSAHREEHRAQCKELLSVCGNVRRGERCLRSSARAGTVEGAPIQVQRERAAASRLCELLGELLLRAAEVCRRALPGSREWHKHAACCNTADSGRPGRLRRRLGHEGCNKRDEGAGTQHNSFWMQYHVRCPPCANTAILARGVKKRAFHDASLKVARKRIVLQRRYNFRYSTCNLVNPATCNLRVN